MNKYEEALENICGELLICDELICTSTNLHNRLLNNKEYIKYIKNSPNEILEQAVKKAQAFDIAVKKGISFYLIYRYKGSYSDYSIAYDNNLVMANEKLTKEEFELLKEVLKNDKINIIKH